MGLSRSEKQMPKKKKRLRKVILFLLLFLIVGGGVYAYSIYHSLNKAINTMHDPMDKHISKKRGSKVNLKKVEPFSVLLLGVDEREGDSGRSDTMILLTVNPHKESLQMLSIPRDTRTEIIGKGTEDKINHAYAYGGVKMSMATVEHFLDIPIDYYVKINMEGFKDIVDAVGGIRVNNELAFSYEGKNFPKGSITLDGEEALSFTRMRYEDPRGDFGRQIRQRQIIQGVIDKGASMSTLWNYDDIFQALGKNIRTNLTFDEMMTIQSKYKKAAKKIVQNEVKGEGKRIGKPWYYIVDDTEKDRLHDLLVDHLNLK
ncbi:LCP family protein required for cell wall assembly [Oikeobacillus pervagus]|uniref:Polyisoprenyl-teichoic acid--peptidoglycan teichoic acid transferase TagU n=1 Tax=Oikeobacillus pervagus TaxID=1325931 RepID=A0AAJ1SYI5_9BACI|nr:LytR family transcriptional regulator [Oikeobacillus pervagus]MDQ0214107.1 LCP family protein required for cell wall assembly [Oikeobacillus pervagus]